MSASPDPGCTVLVNWQPCRAPVVAHVERGSRTEHLCQRHADELAATGAPVTYESHPDDHLPHL